METLRKPFFELLTERIRTTGAPVCVGLDPSPPDAASAQGARDFCLKIIDATSELAAAYKPNSAFFEAFGSAGWQLLTEILAAVPTGIPVLLDAKRGDIASTASAYARAVFEELQADAVTLNPYLGADSIEPFLVYRGKGVFLLCKTSNPGSGWIQDQMLADGRRVYEVVAQKASEMTDSDRIGLVVGATYPQVVGEIRKLAPQAWLLTPGVGPQGGNLAEDIRAGMREDGLGLLLPVSRLISHSHNPPDEMKRLVDTISAIQRTQTPVNAGAIIESDRVRLANDLLRCGCVQFGTFTLKSGLVSPIYVDLRRLASFPAVMVRVAKAFSELLTGMQADCLAGLPYAALPIGTAVSLQTGLPLVYPRKEVKEYGTRVQVEGVWQEGQKAVVIDDLATTGGSKFEAIEKLQNAGLVVEEVVVLIDRQSGARESLQEAGFHLHPVFTLTELLEICRSSGQISHEQIGAVRSFLEAECITPSVR